MTRILVAGITTNGGNERLTVLHSFAAVLRAANAQTNPKQQHGQLGASQGSPGLGMVPALSWTTCVCDAERALMRGPASAGHACEGSIAERQGLKAAVPHGRGESGRVAATKTRAGYYNYRRRCRHRGGLYLAKVAEDSKPLRSGEGNRRGPRWWRRCWLRLRNRNQVLGKTGERI
jgi:hypothetical protein